MCTRVVPGTAVPAVPAAVRVESYSAADTVQLVLYSSQAPFSLMAWMSAVLQY